MVVLAAIPNSVVAVILGFSVVVLIVVPEVAGVLVSDVALAVDVLLDVGVVVVVGTVVVDTSSSAVAKRPRDASCLSVVSFNIPTAQVFYY